jgi:hypothetical protein
MTNHPITPPPELVTSLRNSAPNGIRDAGLTRETWLIHNAYALGADQELEACCEYISQAGKWFAAPEYRVSELRLARRLPSLKERALQAWAAVEAGTDDQTAMAVIRRALEKLND